MKTTKQILSLLLAVALILSVAPMGLFTSASAVDVADSAELTAALVEDATVTLTADVDVDGVLTIPSGATLDLNGNNLYVRGLTNNGNAIVKGDGGKLWADVSDKTSIASAANVGTHNVKNLWVALDELNRTGTEFDGIRIESASISANTYATSNANAALLPNLNAVIASAGRVASSNCYYTLYAPEGKIFDLHGYMIAIYASNTSFGGMQFISTSGGGSTPYVSVQFSSVNSSTAGTLRNAVALARTRPDTKFRIYTSSGSATEFPSSEGYRIPVNAYFAKADSTPAPTGTLTYEVGPNTYGVWSSDSAVFTRTNAATYAKMYVLTEDYNHNASLTLAAGKTLDLNGFNLYVKKFVNNGNAVVKNSGKLWLNSNSAAQVTSSVTVDAANFWLQNEELVREGTEVDGIRLTGNISSVTITATNTNMDTYLPNLKATGAYSTIGTNNFFIPQIPEGKTLDLNNYGVNFYAAVAQSTGDGDIINANATTGRVRLTFNDSNNRGSYENAVAIANARPDLDVYRFVQSVGDGTEKDYSSLAAVPTNAVFALAENALAANLTFMVKDQPGLTRTGTTATGLTGVTLKLANDLALTGNVNVGSANVDYDNHEVTGGEIQTTGTAYNKPASPNVGSKSDLDAAFEAGLTAITLAADIDYNAALTIPADTTVDLNGHKLYVTGLTMESGAAIARTGGGTLWANASVATQITAAEQLANWGNIFAAYEALVGGEPELDGIRLMTNALTSYNNAVANKAARTTYMPNAEILGAFGLNDDRHSVTFIIPSGKTLDLNGKNLQMSASAGTMGEGTVMNGTITTYVRSLNGTDMPYTNAYAITSANNAICNRIYLLAKITFTDAYTVPSGVTLGCNSGNSAGTIVYECASESDFTMSLRFNTGNARPTRVLLTQDLVLANDVNAYGAEIDYAYHTVSGTGSITNKGTEMHILTPNVADKDDLNGALANGITAITLAADIEYTAALTIPVGTTIDLNGHNLYVTGLTNNGTLTKNSGKLWARVTTSGSLTAPPAANGASGLQNLWAANEELLRAGTEFDGIWLAGNLTATANPYGGNSDSIADVIMPWRAANLPNMVAGGCFGSSSRYGIVQIPEGKYLDLNGTTLTIRATQMNFGAGTVIANGGSVILWYSGTTSSVGNQVLECARSIAVTYPGLVSRFNQTATGPNYNSYPIPSGVELTFANSSTPTGTVTFEVANEADFTRTGYTYANVFKLTGDLTLTDNVDVGSVNVDYAYHTVTGGTITTSGDSLHVLTPNVVNAEDLAAAIEHDITAITLTADIDFGAVLEIPSGTTIDLDGHKLTVRNTTLASFGEGTITDSSEGETGLVAIKLSNTESVAKLEYLDAVEASYQQGRSGNPNFKIKRIELGGNLNMSVVDITTTGGTETKEAAAARWTYAASKYAGAVVTGNLWVWAGVPAGVTIDLRGYTLTARAVNTGFGAIEDTSAGQNGKLILYAWNGVPRTLLYAPAIFEALDNNAPNLQLTITNSITPVGAEPENAQYYTQAITVSEDVKMVVNSGLTIALDEGGSFVFKSGATLVPTTPASFTITAPEGVIFEVATEADFTRAGIQYATLVKLASDVTLTGAMDISSLDFDFNGHYIIGNTVTAKSYAQTGGGGYEIIVDNESDLRTAVGTAHTGKIVIAGNVTLTANLAANNIPIEVAASYTFSTGGFALSKTVVTSGAPEYGVFDGVVSADEVYVTDATELDAALAGASDVIKLSNDINYNAALTIPFGKTVDLCGNNLYVTGYTCLGTLNKNSGKLWANVSNNTKLTAQQSLASGLENLWAANEALLVNDSPFDGMRLAEDITTYDSDHYAVTNDAARAAYLPNLNNEGAFTTGLQYAIMRIPAGKTLDLNGHVLHMVAANTTMGTNTQGDGTVTANGGSIVAHTHNQATYRMATQLVANYPGVFTKFLDSRSSAGTAVNCASYPLPAGIEMDSLNNTYYNLTVECATEADFTRVDTSNELISIAKFVVVDDITLTQDLVLGETTLFINDGCEINLNGHSIITTGTVRAEISSLADLERDDVELATEVRLMDDIALTGDLELSKDLIVGYDEETGNGYTLDLAGHTLDLGEGKLSSSFGFITDASTANAANDTFGLVKAGGVTVSNTGRNLDITGYEEAIDPEVRNAYQPLYDSTAGGYRFFQIANNIRTAATVVDGKLTFKFIFNFSNAAAWDLVLEGDSEMAFWFSLKNAETLDGEVEEVLYYLNAATMADYATKQKEQVGQSSQYQLLATIRAPYSSDVKGKEYDYNDKWVWSDPYLGSTQTAKFAYENHGNTKFSPKYFTGGAVYNAVP